MTRRLEHLPSVETTDVSPRRVLLALGIVFILMTSCMAAAVAAVSWAKPERSVASTPDLRLGIRLEVAPLRQERRIEAAAARRLAAQGRNSSGPVSTHLPIEEAMALLVRRGWPQGSTPRQRSGSKGADIP